MTTRKWTHVFKPSFSMYCDKCLHYIHKMKIVGISSLCYTNNPLSLSNTNVIEYHFIHKLHQIIKHDKSIIT